MTRIMNFDLRHPAQFGTSGKDIYQGALDLVEWADANGFDRVQVSEHHQNEDGYISCPLMFAAAVGGRTKRLRVHTNVLLGPLYEPLRLAEEIAVADLCLGGRLTLALGLGTQPDDFKAFGVDFKDRGRLGEELIPFLRQAWTGEPFEFRGTTVMVRPTPVQERLPIYLGGVTKAGIERAARLGDNYQSANLEHWEMYREACKRIGKPDPGPRPKRGPMFLWVTKDDKEKVRAELEPHFRYQAQSYIDQTNQRLRSLGKEPLDPEKDSGPYVTGGGQADPYQIMNPEEAIQLADSLGPDGEFVLHPLLAGIAPKKALAMVKLLETDVFPHIKH